MSAVLNTLRSNSPSPAEEKPAHAVSSGVASTHGASSAEKLVSEFLETTAKLALLPEISDRTSRSDGRVDRPSSISDRLRSAFGSGSTEATRDAQREARSELELARDSTISSLQRYDLHHQFRLERFVSKSLGYVSPITHSPGEVVAAHTNIGVAKVLLVILNFERDTQHFLPDRLSANELSSFFAERRKELVSSRLEAVDCSAADYAVTSKREYERIPHQKILRLWDAATNDLVNVTRGREAINEAIEILASDQKMDPRHAEILLNQVMNGVGIGALSPRYIDAAIPLIRLEKLTDDPQGKAALEMLTTQATRNLEPHSEERMLTRYAELRRTVAISESMPSNARDAAKFLLHERTSAVGYLTSKGGRLSSLGLRNGLPKPEAFDVSDAEGLMKEILQIRSAAHQTSADLAKIELKLLYATRLIIGAAALEDRSELVSGALSRTPPSVDALPRAIQLLEYLALGCGLPRFDGERLTPLSVEAIAKTIEQGVSVDACALFSRDSAGKLVAMSTETAFSLLSAALTTYK